LVREATLRGQSWDPLSVGMFSGSIDRFNELTKAYREQVLNQARLNYF